MEISQHITALERDGAELADAAVAAGLAADVPGCPGWRVRDLVRHQAFVHSWAARHVAERRVQLIEGDTEDGILGDDRPDDQLMADYRAGHAALVRTLREANPDVHCATFLDAPSPLAFWARRQAHETAIHRFDAQSARADGPPCPRKAFDPPFAADGIDELLMGFAARRMSDGACGSLLVRTSDTGHAWCYTWPATGRVRARRCRPGKDATDADCTLTGPASGVYLVLWNRCAAGDAGLAVTGDAAILDTWHSSVRVRWE